MDGELEKKLSFIESTKISTADPKEIWTHLNSRLQAIKPITQSQFGRLLKLDQLPIDNEGGLLIEPDKGFCIKAFNSVNGEKIFINITAHNAIDKPEETEVLQGDGPSAGFRVPMSVLPPITHHAKEIGLIIDACVNSYIITKLKAESFKGETINFFIGVLFNFFYQKFQIQCSEKFEVLKNCKYKGTYLQTHRIRFKKAPKIKVVDKKEDSNINELITQTPSGVTGIKPDFDVILLYDNDEEEVFDGINWDGDAIGIGFIFKMPLLTTGIFIDTLVNDEELEVRNKIYEIVLRMPRRIQVDTYKRSFDQEKRELKITGRFIQIREEVLEARVGELQSSKNAIVLKSPLIEDIM